MAFHFLKIYLIATKYYTISKAMELIDFIMTYLLLCKHEFFFKQLYKGFMIYVCIASQ